MKLPRLTGLRRRHAPSREDVLWCYRALLEREPESAEAVQAHLACADVALLVRTFIESPEYRRLRQGQRRHPFPLPAQAIDVRVDERRLIASVSKVKAAWSHLGEVRPHFSVLTSPAFMPENLPSSIGSFWASGEDEAAQVVSVLAAHGVSAAGKVCLEYGCGVGRVTGGLASHFGHVHGYDISPGHLREARTRMQTLGRSNVSLLHCQEAGLEVLQACDVFYSRIVLQHNPPPLMHALVRSLLHCQEAGLEVLQACDVFYSRIVLQHNPPPLMHALVRSLLDALRPGGTGIFQLPTYAEDYSFDIDAWLAADAPLDMEMHCLPIAYVLESIHDAGCVALDVREEGSTGSDRFISNVFVVRRPGLPSLPADRPHPP